MSWLELSYHRRTAFGHVFCPGKRRRFFCIPYDEADDMSTKHFCIEDAKMLDAVLPYNFTSDW